MKAHLTLLVALPFVVACATERVVPPRAAAQAIVVTSGPVQAPPADEMPTMPYERFMPSYEDHAKRDVLWARFQSAEALAKRFAATPADWVVIQRVDVGSSGAKWMPAGFIELEPNTDPGTLFHEIFHTAFHRSAFHQGADEGWGEAFCDAFRFFAEKEILGVPASDWETKVERFTTQTFDEVMARSGDPSHDKKYAFPASLVVARSGGSMAGLRRLWRELSTKRSQRDGDVLDDFFHYRMSEGHPM